MGALQARLERIFGSDLVAVYGNADRSDLLIISSGGNWEKNRYDTVVALPHIGVKWGSFTEF